MGAGRKPSVAGTEPGPDAACAAPTPRAAGRNRPGLPETPARLPATRRGGHPPAHAPKTGPENEQFRHVHNRQAFAGPGLPRATRGNRRAGATGGQARHGHPYQQALHAGLGRHLRRGHPARRGLRRDQGARDRRRRRVALARDRPGQLREHADPGPLHRHAGRRASGRDRRPLPLQRGAQILGAGAEPAVRRRLPARRVRGDIAGRPLRARPGTGPDGSGFLGRSDRGLGAPDPCRAARAGSGHPRTPGDRQHGPLAYGPGIRRLPGAARTCAVGRRGLRRRRSGARRAVPVAAMPGDAGRFRRAGPGRRGGPVVARRGALGRDP